MYQTTIKYNSDSDWKAKGLLQKIQEVNVEPFNFSSDRDALVFWIAHFMGQVAAPMDHFKIHLEEYCKIVVPMNSSLLVEI